VYDGEFLTLLGPSGSGKTTLLQMIAGLVEPTEGTLLIDGRDATYSPAGERGVGMVFQSYALFPHLTVWENVAYPLRMRKIASDGIRAMVEAALRMVKMESYGERYPRELSGGQQQRIALARCLVYRPSVILLDEPLGALDKKLREHMQIEISGLHKELGATFIYVTHDQEEALTLSDRVCLMTHARIEQIGTPEEIYDRPVSRFAADFVGSSNILDGVLLRRKGRSACLQVGTFALPLPMQDFADVENASLLVRPEVAHFTAPGEGYVAGTVSEVVFTGSNYRAVVAIGLDEGFEVHCGRQALPAPGEAVGLRWDPARTTVLIR
jgi:putative spermidine/putrescine transport system ATP-binding protein